MDSKDPAITTWDGAKTPWILGYLLHQLVSRISEPSTVAPPTNKLQTFVKAPTSTKPPAWRIKYLDRLKIRKMSFQIGSMVGFCVNFSTNFTRKRKIQVWWNYTDIDFKEWPENLDWWIMIIVVQTDIFRGVIIMFNLFELCSMATKKGIPTDLFSSWASSKWVAPRGLLGFSRIGRPIGFPRFFLGMRQLSIEGYWSKMGSPVFLTGKIVYWQVLFLGPQQF